MAALSTIARALATLSGSCADSASGTCSVRVESEGWVISSLLVFWFAASCGALIDPLLQDPLSSVKDQEPKLQKGLTTATNWYINRILIKIYWYTINGKKFYADTKQKIIDKRLLPGQWLVEKELCVEYGICIIPLREALQSPVAEGLLGVARSKKRLV